jgi:carbonic anhydrase/acetyltransferase-like protein (isoleucine patch superfamily)
MKKYELGQKEHGLYRVIALRDFGDVKKGDEGGFVESEDNLSHEGNCWVSGNARVSGDAWVRGEAVVYGNAWVSGDALVSGNARVFGNAKVYGDTMVYGDAVLSGNARIYGNAVVDGNIPDCEEHFVDEFLPSAPMSTEDYLRLHKEFTDKMHETTKKKNSDYTGGSTDDPFKNFKAVEVGGVTTEQGFFTRLTDKYMRLAGFVNGNTLKVKDESVEDTLLDMANYCILFACYLKDNK